MGGGDITILSGVGIATSSGSIIMSTADADPNGVSGPLHLSTGHANAGSSGSIQLSTGSAMSGVGGSVSIEVGSGDSGDGGAVLVNAGFSSSSFGQGGNIDLLGGSSSFNNGGSIFLAGGVGSSGVGGNIYIQPGLGSSDGSVFFMLTSGVSMFGVISESIFDFSISSSVRIQSFGIVDISSGSTITLSAANGIDLGDSYIHGFESGSGSTINNEVTINKQAGYFLMPGPPMNYDSENVTMYNDRSQEDSIVIATVMESPGATCTPIIRRARAFEGYIRFEVFNYYYPMCIGNVGISFFLIN